MRARDGRQRLAYSRSSTPVLFLARAAANFGA
jgi:hypothetical protein